MVAARLPRIGLAANLRESLERVATFNEALPVNYYKRHLGDYAKKAGHLTPLEHGVYTLILDAYYDREQALTEDQALRVCRAITEDERNAVHSVLKQFFVQDGDVFRQNRVEDELDNFRERQKINRLLGKKGGKRNAKRNAKRNWSESLSETEANAKPSHKPQATTKQHPPTPQPKQPQDPPPIPAGLDLSPEVWLEFITHRRQIRKPISVIGQRRMLERLTQLAAEGSHPDATLRQSIGNGWSGVFPVRGAGIAVRRPSLAEQAAAGVEAFERRQQGAGHGH